MSLIILFYGLIVYINPAYKDTPVFFVFVGILMTGIFMLNYGQFVPAWDSNCMMMSQNIPMKQYLNSKGINVGFCADFGILSTPIFILGGKS
jgi:hypothetical protein